ncbi:MAG: EAL domain-containing protein [Alphaproteobacteria bacterium]|nr:EAL domain-containing protein [Alphaproteobacteria bacterium]
MSWWKQITGLALAVVLLAAPEAYSQASELAPSPYADAIEAARTNMMSDPVAALENAQRAEQLVPVDFDGDTRNLALASAAWLQSEAMTRLGRPGEALPVAERALALLGEDPAPTKLFADTLLSIGRILKLTGEHGQALEILQQAFDVYAAIGETRSQAIVLQSIGSIYNDARQYERAIEYFADAVERHRDTNLDLAAFNNLGNAYTALEQYSEALEYYDQALAAAEAMDSGMLQARILNNVASLHIANGDWTAAEASVDQAFAAAGDASGGEWSRFLWGVRAQAALGREDYQAARTGMERVFEGVAVDETNHHFTDFHDSAARLYEALGEYELAIAHLRAFKRLEDDGREFAANANSALIGAQFDFAAQDLQIQQLRAEGLARDLALAQSEARQRLMVGLSAGGLMLLALIGMVMAMLGFRARARLMREQLNTDAETGLPTRHALVAKRDQAVRDGASPEYVAVIHLERASHIESLLGFANFIEMQRLLGERLQAIDGVTSVALIGAGQFGTVLDTTDELVVEDEISTLSNIFSQPISIDGVSVDVSATIGLDNDARSEIAVRNAIIAVSQAHEKGAAFALYNEHRFGDPKENLNLMTRMLAATESGDMQMHYQPKLDLRKGVYTSAEALCRWNDPERGYISPDTFIPQAEETGKIRELTEWTVRKVLQDKRRLIAAGHEISVAINISGRLLADPKFGQRILEIVGFGATGLIFEITETAMMSNPDRAMHNLDRWVDAGIRLAIDDYGTGFSSLAYLKRLPCHELKIDRVFVKGAHTSAKDRTLLKSTIDLAHNLGMSVTAEGVEGDDILSALSVMGCDMAQGFGLSKALPADELLKFLEQHTSTVLPARPAANPFRNVNN